MFAKKSWLLLLIAIPAWAQDDPTMPPLLPGTGAPETRHAGTDMHFLAYRGDEPLSVKVGDQACDTPCTLRLPPGPTKVHVTGSGESELQMVVPHLTAQVRIATGPPGWYLPAGIVLIPLGLVIGASMWALGLTCGFAPGRDLCYQLNFIAWPVLGVAMLITGSVLLGVYNRTQPADANRVEILDVARRERRLRFEQLALSFLRNGLALAF